MFIVHYRFGFSPMSFHFIPVYPIHCFRRKIAGGVTSLCFNELFYGKTVTVNSKFICVSFKEESFKHNRVPRVLNITV